MRSTAFARSSRPCSSRPVAIRRILVRVSRLAIVVVALALGALASCAAIAGLGDYRTGDEDDGGLVDANGFDAPPPPPEDDGSHPGDAGADAATDMVAFFPFNEGSGTKAVDATGHGHDAVLSNATWVAGADGGSAIHVNSLTFPKGHVDVSSLAGTAFPQLAGTVAFLFRVESYSVLADDEGVFDALDTTRSHFYARRSAVSTMEVGVELQANDAGGSFPQDFTPGTWVRVVFSWDLQKSSAVFKIGAKALTLPSIVVQFLRPTGQRVVLLQDCGGCSMDDLRIYGRGMTESEITKLFP